MDLTAAQQRVAEAAASSNAKLRKHVETFMPGVSALTMEPFRFSVGHVAYVAVGTWCDQTFEFEQFSDGVVRGYAVARCSSCNNYVHCAEARALRSADAITRAIKDGIAATWTTSIAQCPPCQDVVAAKADAEEVTSRFKAWRYRVRWGMTHTDVLALPH